MIEKKLKFEQIKVRTGKKYLLNILYNNRVILVAALLPAFILGWKQARAKGAAGKMVKQLLRYSLLAAFANVKKQILIK